MADMMTEQYSLANFKFIQTVMIVVLLYNLKL